MKIDSHQHFWRYNEAQYPWIPKNSPLQCDWLPEDWRAAACRVGVQGSVAVQARQTIEESRWLLQLAEQHSSIKGVVGWVDLRSDKLEQQLKELAQHPKFVGVRHVVQDEPDGHFMLREDFQRGIALLKKYQLAYDILIFPKQLPAALELVKTFPEQLFALDHIAKPFIKDGVLSPWREQICTLAESRNVYCKVSGMVTEARHGAWKKEQFRPYLETVFAAFGEDRLMFGSDWPVCLLSASYNQVLEIVEDFLKKFDQKTREKVMGQNAARFYGIKS